MAQNAYPSNINNNNSSIVAQDNKKRVHYRDDPETNSNSEKYDRNEANEEEELPFYPAFCFPASPTHFTWVKMSIADIHRLQSRRGFEGIAAYLCNLSCFDLTIYRPGYILPQEPPHPVRLSSRLHPHARRIRAPHRAHGRRQQRLHP
jgi:hypothetical protein